MLDLAHEYQIEFFHAIFNCLIEGQPVLRMTRTWQQALLITSKCYDKRMHGNQIDFRSSIGKGSAWLTSCQVKVSPFLLRRAALVSNTVRS
jgi:hypothetical protein